MAQPAGARCEIAAVRFHLADGSMREAGLEQSVIVAPEVRRDVHLPSSTIALSAVARGCWVERSVVEQSANEIVLRAWPLATLTAGYERIRPEPSSVRVSFVDTAAAEAETVQEATCSRDGAAVQCDLPAGRTMHVRVEWDGYAPVYAKNVSVAEGRTVDLGRSDLVRAYNVTGRVVARDGSPLANARVRLLPATAGELTKAERVLRTITATSDARGNYRIAGVAPGSYRLVSEVTGRADAVIDPLRVISQDVHAAQLVHTSRGRVEVVLSPPVAPDATPWKLELSRRGTRQFERLVVASAAVPINGVWQSEPLENAEYTVEISTRRGSEVARKEVVVDGDDQVVLIAISGIAVSGRLLSGDDGVAGELTFSHPSGQQVRAAAATDGSFGALFPQPGKWRVNVAVPPSSIRLRLDDVEIRESQQESLEIRLAAGRIEGVVVDAKGKPVVAAVNVSRNGHSVANGLSGDDGSFAIDHIAAGKYAIDANSSAGFAAPVEITVEEDEPAKVRLTLAPARTVDGVVTGPSGRPLSGAVVRVVELATSRVQEKIADAEGRFAVALRTGGTIDVIVLAPPAPVVARRLAPPQWQDQLVAIAVPPASATLRLIMLRNPPWPVLTAADGAARSLGLFVMPRFGSSAVMQEFIDGAVQFTIEPGTYTTCLATDCRQIVLHAGSVATLNFITPQEKP